MQENKNLVEEAFIQMKNVQEGIAENAKGILASVMKEEISQLVKESLTEQEELDLDVDTEVDDISVDNDDDTEVSDVDMMEPEMDSEVDDIEMDVDFDSTPVDLRGFTDDEVLKVFKAMGEDDGIIVAQDDDTVHLTDNETDSEYLIKLGESMEENNEGMEYTEEEDDEVQKVIDAIFSDGSDVEETDMSDENEEEVMYEIEFTEESDDEDDSEESEMEESEMEESEMEESEMEESEMEESEMEESENEEGWHMDESYSHKKVKKMETKESKMSVKPKGVGLGHGPKFTYKKSKGGFKEDKKEAPKSIGTGKAKFTYKEGENLEGDMKPIKKMETKEASRTYGMGSQEGRGLRKGITPNRNLKFESLETEVKSLRDKNEEYRKALNVFREKLNEVAVFNSNLAYATRLFTEHSTTKKEKINILRRFDGVESLKESKTLYKSIKEELSKTETKSLNETVENKLNNTVQTGSSTTLIESKTYEAPQFLRIKDLMSKIS